MEMRGDLRRGEFVEGRGPIQYAEEETVESLRRKDRREAGEPALAVAAAADPVLDGLDLRDGWAALAGGETLATLDGAGAFTTTGDATDRAVKSAVTALQDLLRRARDPLGRPRTLVVSTVNGRAAAGAPLAPVLEELGFSRDLGTLVWRAL
jgi:hypothetical protein